ncbi:hypothetical protein [Stieleria varia]|uniref:Uncharacterized protein n=1 Tax=Stieleria varia TaxID=2528005 RepID=A0A5C6ANH5_9BACT|nr:hypothetical protein [Stieleria varia]TWU00799.1 hypothetical protein Pla52n_41680 [Stieleria varia]
MPNDTNNSLTDFDMCLALAQKAIDSQIASAWKEWVSRSEFSDSGDDDAFGYLDVYMKSPKTGKPTPLGMSAELAPLTVSLNVPNAKLGQVEVTIRLRSGTVTYFDQFEFEKATCPIDNWSVSFLTDLDTKPVDPELLRKIDPKAAERADEVIKNATEKNPGLDDSYFSIEYLFMKFTKIDLLLVDNKSINIPNEQTPENPDGIPLAARTQALVALNTVLQGDGTNEFMLGTVVRREKKNQGDKPIPTFAMTDFAFNIFSDPVDPTASTLSYLGMFSGNVLPKGQDLDRARVKLQDNWVRPERLNGTDATVSGTMAISAHTFLDNYLIPKITQALGMTPKRDAEHPLKWNYSNAWDQKQTIDDIIRRKFFFDWSKSLSVEVMTGQAVLNITGKISSSIGYDGYTHGAEGLGIGRSEWIAYAGHRTITTSLQLRETGGSVGFGIAFDIPDADYFGPVVVDKDEIEGFAKVNEAVGGVLKGVGIIGDTPAAMLESSMSKTVEALRSELDSALKNLDVELNQQAFIPPGGGVFTFQNVRFSAVGDVLLDVIYKAA